MLFGLSIESKYLIKPLLSGISSSVTVYRKNHAKLSRKTAPNTEKTDQNTVIPKGNLFIPVLTV